MCRNTAAKCIFLPFGTPDSGSKFQRYQVFLRDHWASASMTKGNRLWKRKRNVLRRDDYFYVHNYPFQILHYWPSVKSMTGYIWPNSFFSLLLDFLKVLYFFHRWLCHETSSFARFLRGLMHWSSLRSLLRTYKRSTCSKSSILFTKTMSGPMKKRTTPIYATCTSPIMYLICPSKLNIMVMQNLRGGGGGGGK